jgi:predicted hotdog family 3-hydroxylacyl-ACP dehydratase
VSYPPIDELVPHGGPMCLLSRVLAHDAAGTVCSVTPGPGDLLAGPDGAVPVWAGLEYMAQCVAVHGGLRARRAGHALRPGLFLGSRRVNFGVQSFAPGRALRVAARHHAGETGLVAFDCEVRDDSAGAPLVQARVNVYIVDDWQELGAPAE